MLIQILLLLAGDRTATTPDQEVSKAAPEATRTAHPGGGRAAAPSCDLTEAGTSNCPGTPNLLDCSFMTGDELKAFGEFSTCSGASAKIAALAEIKADFFAGCGGRREASGGHHGAAPEITISGSSIKEAVLRGVGQLAREIEAREEALENASSRSTEMARQWGLFLIMWKGLEKKNKSWQVEVESCERNAAQQEQQLAAREVELAREVKALDLRKEELEGEVERRLAEAEKRHQEALDDNARDVRDSQLKETDTRKAA